MTAPRPLRIALIGIGKIARDQHVPVLAARQDAELVATVSRNAEVDGIPGFKSLAEAFDRVPEIEAVTICTPPIAHYQQAKEAMLAGRHVFLEKPPAASLSEIESLRGMASEHGLTLFASWHSRFAAAVEPARSWLADKTLKNVHISWKEDVRRWHPGQDWLFESRGMGVFDPGINALSIATRILPRPFILRQASLEVPANRQAPISASLRFVDEAGVPITAEFDFREQGLETWEFHVETEQGKLCLSAGGAKITIDGLEQSVGPTDEYAGLYDRFIELVRERRSDVDSLPLVHVADAFLLGERLSSEPFDW